MKCEPEARKRPRVLLVARSDLQMPKAHIISDEPRLLRKNASRRKRQKHGYRNANL